MINGERGAGKSNFALELAGWLDRDNFTLDNIAFLPEDILNVSSKLKRYSVIIIDEAGESYSNLDFLTQIQRALHKAMIGNRSQNLHWLWIAPRFADVGSGIRNMCTYELELSYRGASIIYILTRSYYRKYDLPRRDEYFRWYIPKSGIYEEYRKLKNDAGRERIKKYLEEINEERKGYTIEWLRNQIESEIDKFKNRKGRVDWQIIYVGFKQYNFSQIDCKVVATVINRELEETGDGE